MAKSKAKILRQRSIHWGIRCLGWRPAGEPLTLHRSHSTTMHNAAGATHRSRVARHRFRVQRAAQPG